MAFAGMRAGDIGVEALDPVHEAVFDQKVERPVGHRRLRAKALRLEPVEDLVGAKRLVLVEQDLEDALPDRGELQPVRRAIGMRRREPLGPTPIVIMRGHSDRIHAVLPKTRLAML